MECGKNLKAEYYTVRDISIILSRDLFLRYALKSHNQFCFFQDIQMEWITFTSWSNAKQSTIWYINATIV